MRSLTSKNDFPSKDDLIYLNAANVALMYDGARQAIIDWTQDLAENGSNNFDEIAEANVSKPCDTLQPSCSTPILRIFLLGPVPRNCLVH